MPKRSVFGWLAVATILWLLCREAYCIFFNATIPGDAPFLFAILATPLICIGTVVLLSKPESGAGTVILPLIVGSWIQSMYVNEHDQSRDMLLVISAFIYGISAILAIVSWATNSHAAKKAL